MLTDFLSAERTWVITQTSEDDFPVGVLIDFVINPDSGVFEALWVRTQDGLLLLSMDDILQWTRDKIVIRDEGDLMPPEKFPRIQKTLEREVPIRNAKVFYHWPEPQESNLWTPRMQGIDTHSDSAVPIHRNGVSDQMLPSLARKGKQAFPSLAPFSNENDCIGRVKNFGFDTLSPKILTLIVRSGFLFWSDERIIPRSKILRITEKGIFVSGNEIKKTDEKIVEKNIILPEINRP